MPRSGIEPEYDDFQSSAVTDLATSALHAAQKYDYRRYTPPKNTTTGMDSD